MSTHYCHSIDAVCDEENHNRSTLMCIFLPVRYLWHRQYPGNLCSVHYRGEVLLFIHNFTIHWNLGLCMRPSVSNKLAITKVPTSPAGRLNVELVQKFAV